MTELIEADDQGIGDPAAPVLGGAGRAGAVELETVAGGVVLVPQQQDAKTVSEDDVLEATLDAGAEDVNDLGEAFEVISEPTDLVAVRSALQAGGIAAGSRIVVEKPFANRRPL